MNSDDWSELFIFFIFFFNYFFVDAVHWGFLFFYFYFLGLFLLGISSDLLD